MDGRVKPAHDGGGFSGGGNPAKHRPMKINGTPYRSVWPIGADAFGIIDQTRLPHEFVTLTLTTADQAAHAIKSMQTRGAPLIGAVAAYGLALAVRADPSDENLTAT